MIDEKRRLIVTIEQINNEKREILESKEYKLGKNILKMLEYVKHFRVNKIIKVVTIKHKNKIERKKFYQHQPEKLNIDTNKTTCSVEDKKIVVYTCITGNYDQVLEPLYHNDNVDYVIFTNCKNIDTKIWKKKEIPNDIKLLNNNIMINRYIKTHPRELFEDEYDYSIYIDGNIKTISDVSGFINSIKQKTGLALHKHYVRDCIYCEEKVCELYKKGNIENLRNQIERYKNEGMPENYGLLECNVIVSDLKNNTAQTILNNWWEEFEKSKSMRDQIAFPYVLWKMGYKVEDIGNIGNNVYVNPKIIINPHN